MKKNFYKDIFSVLKSKYLFLKNEKFKYTDK